MKELVGRRIREAFGDTKRRCTATNRQGEQCGRAPIPGGNVCVLHGGANPDVKRAAQARLNSFVEPALDVLERAMRSAAPCPHCGRSDSDRDPVALAAAKTILDRTGLSAAATVEQPTPTMVETNYAAWLPDSRLQQMKEWMDEAKQAMAAGLSPARAPLRLPPAERTDDAIEGEVVEADPELAHGSSQVMRRRGFGFVDIPAAPRKADR